MKKTVLALTGMPGAGKSIAAQYFLSRHFPVIRFGDLVDDLLKEKNLPSSEENEHRIRQSLRETDGMDIFAVKALPKIIKALQNQHIVVVDGMRSYEEYLFLKPKLPNLFIVAILASPKIRYQRLKSRTSRPLSLKEARARDQEELTTLHACPTIALADISIVNEGTIATFHHALAKIVDAFNAK